MTSSAQSLIYSHQNLYQLLMHVLYGRYFNARYQAVADEIPAGASVVDMCAGNGYLYLNYLRRKNVQYLGLDISPQLVRWAQQHDVPMQRSNVWEDEIPIGDSVVMQASLYQFIPQADLLLRKMLLAARDRVIVTEPIRNLSSSRNPLFSIVGRRLTVPPQNAGRYHAQRFDYRSLLQLFESIASFESARLLPGGREVIGIFKGQFTQVSL